MTTFEQAQTMLRQLSFPIEAHDTIKARRERAARKSGLTSSKAFRLWYGQQVALLADEWMTLCARYRAHVEEQEARLEAELQALRALKAARTQMDLVLPTPASTDVESVGLDRD